MAKPTLVDVFKEFLGADWFDAQVPAAPTPVKRSTNTALAQYLLTHSKPGPTLKPFETSSTKEGAAGEEPSFLNKAFDFLDTVTLARSARNAADSMIPDENKGFFENLGSELGGIGKAVAGGVLGAVNDVVSAPLEALPVVGDHVEKISNPIDDFADKLNPDTRGSKILERTGVDNKYAKSIGGFGLELGLDPSWLIGAGAIKTLAGKGAETAGDVVTKAAATGDNSAGIQNIQNLLKGRTLTSDTGQTLKGAVPDIPIPPVANMAMKGGQAPGRIGDFAPTRQFELPMPKEVTPDVSTPMGSQEIAYGILNDPVSFDAMKKMKKSDDGWRAAQKRWGRDPDVEQAALDNAISKAAWFEQKQQQKLAKAGKVTDGKGNVSQISVARVLKDIEQGNIPRWGPEPAKATGLAEDIAIKAADDQVATIAAKGTRGDLNPANQANLYNRLFDSTADVFRNDPQLAKKYAGKKGTVNINSPRALKARRVMARAMLRTAEDHLIQVGKMPAYWDGTRVRLSEVLEEIGLEANDELATKVLSAWKTRNMQQIKEPAVAEAITRALARRPLHLSHMLEDMSLRAKEASNNILAHYTYPKAQEKLAELANDAADVARRAGLTNEEVDAVSKLVANVVDVDKMPQEKFLAMLGGRLNQAVKEGRMDADALYKVNKEISRVLGQTKKDLMTNVSGNKVIDGFMLRFSTSYGRLPEMKRFADDVMTWGEMNATARARWMRNMVHMAGNNKEASYQAFKIAQGMADASVFPDPAVQKLASQITDYFETMLGSSGMSKLMQENTVATKSQIVMEDVNKQLKAVGSNFQFTNKKGVKDQFLGLTHDFSATGEGWVGSWKLANPKGAKQDPVSFLYDLDLAIERTVKEYSLIDEFGRSFGVRKGDINFDKNVHTARLKSDRLPHDVYFTPEHRDMMQRLLNDIDEGLWRPNSKLVQHYARGLRIWKTGVTIYTPAHHIRNMIGDLHMMWWAGHNDPRNFIKAAKILHSQKSRYEAAMKMDTLDALKGLIDKDAMEWAKTTGGDPIIKQNGVTLTADQIYVAAHQHGLLLDANKYEDIFGQAPLENVPGLGKLSPGMQKRIAEPLGGKAHHIAARTLAENREHYVRLAHFVGAINKGLKKSNDLEKILANAAQEVRKWHPDGRDLTQFEQKARLLIPFYSWTRKAIPLIVQSAVTRPAKVLYYPRAQMALAEMLGTNEDPTMLDPFPDNQLFPEWIRAKGIGPVFDPQSENAVSSFFGKFGNNSVNINGEETGYVIANPSNPFNDVVESITGFGKGPTDVIRSVFDSSTPAVKIPGEIWKDQTFSGAPISADKPGGKGMFNYLFNQIPIVSTGNNVIEWEPGVEKKPEGREQGKDIQALINTLTALGLRGTGPYEKSAEFEAKDRASK